MWPLNDFGGVAEAVADFGGVAGETVFLAAGSVNWEPITGASLAHCLKDLFQESAISAMATTISRRRRIFEARIEGGRWRIVERSEATDYRFSRFRASINHRSPSFGRCFSVALQAVIGTIEGNESDNRSRAAHGVAFHVRGAIADLDCQSPGLRGDRGEKK
jgi:hypothetical protein